MNLPEAGPAATDNHKPSLGPNTCSAPKPIAESADAPPSAPYPNGDETPSVVPSKATREPLKGAPSAKVTANSTNPPFSPGFLPTQAPRTQTTALSPKTPCATSNPEERANIATATVNSTNSTPLPSPSQAVYPGDTILDSYMDYARSQAESADSFLLGSFLPLVSACLARRNWIKWGRLSKYPNLFSLLVGPSGDRKSTAISIVKDLATQVLPEAAFLPESCSGEALFDSYDQDRGGRPDKILVCDDANPLFAVWSKTSYGEIVGKIFLRLFDCCELRESFRGNRRNGEKIGAEAEKPNSLRCIPETSTSMILGATPNIALFQGQEEIRSGMPRRFLYYAAEDHGRLLVLPADSDPVTFTRLCNQLNYIATLDGVTFRFNAKSLDLWTQLQQENRRKLKADRDDCSSEAHFGRLNSQPMHVLKVAVVFQACRWALHQDPKPDGIIQPDILDAAMRHVEHCSLAATYLEQIGDRVRIRADADYLLAKICCTSTFGTRVQGWVQATKSQLTSQFCHHADRPGCWKPDYLYLKLVPDLVKRGKAKEIQTATKQVKYAFLVEQ